MEKHEYSKQLRRLQEEQEKALRETNEKINQWQKFKSDYEALKERLKTLPDKLSHDVMVPFGKMAFMPGQLVHTNEILVLLGDNWFVERSAKQAADIVDRRMKSVNSQIEDLYKQRKLLEPRREFTSELQTMTQGGAGVMDIREDYDEDKERQWKETHKKNVRKHRLQLKRTQNGDQPRTDDNQPAKSDEELWARLDQLEQLELEGREMQKLGTGEAELPGYPLDLPWSSKTAEPETSKQRMGTSRKSKYSREQLDSDDDDNDSSVSDSSGSDEEEILGKGKIIHFQHSKTEPSAEREKVSDDSSQVALEDTVQSPLDIYTKFSSCFGPRSILKVKTEHKKQRHKKPRERKVAFETDELEGQAGSLADTIQVEEKLQQQPAFSGTVIEKPLTNIALQSQTLDNTLVKEMKDGPAKDNSETKPVSRFKAQRLGKTGR